MNQPNQPVTASTAWPKHQCLFVVALLFAAPLVVAQTSAPKNDGNIETVTVVGTREAGYRATTAITANKTDSPLLEVPFSVQVVTRELIEDRGVYTFGEAVRTLPGVTSQVGFVGGNDRFRLRGFATPSNLKNGVRRAVFIPVDEMANIEQVEVLKGPASALYGRFEPGGAVNLVTKKPRWERETAFEYTGGDFNFNRATLDTTGPINNEFAYRLNAAWQDSESFRDFVYTDQTFIAPAFAWNPSESTRVVFEAEYLDKEFGPDRGFGNSPLFLELPIHRNFSEPYASVTNISELLSLKVEHDLNEDWMLRVVGMSSDSESDGTYIAYGFPPLSGAGGPSPQVNRISRGMVDRERDTTGQIELSGKAQLFNLEHRLLIGAEASRSREGLVTQNVNLLPISFWNPQFGQVPGAPAGDTTFNSSQETSAIYVQDEIRLSDQWLLLGGLRYDGIDYTSQDTYVMEGREGEGSDNAVSPRVGLTFMPSSSASIYASWSESFLPDVFARMADGSVPEPSRGEQFETGIKMVLFNGRLTPTLAWFDIARKKTTISDPNDPTFTYSIAAGEQQSKGWELDLPIVINDRWRLLASYTYLDAKFTDNPGLIGNRLANAPRDNASLWTSYDLGGNLAGLSVGTGVHYVGARQATDSNTFTLESYIRLDANIAYVFGGDDQWRIQLNAQNLTDEGYFESGGSFVPTYPGAPRAVTASLRATF